MPVYIREEDEPRCAASDPPCEGSGICLFAGGWIMDPKGRGVVLQSCWIVHAGKWFNDVSRGAAGSGAQQCLARHRRGRCASLSEVDLASATKALFGNRLAPRIYGAGKPSSRIFNCSSVSSAPGAAEQSVSEQVATVLEPWTQSRSLSNSSSKRLLCWGCRIGAFQGFDGSY